MLKTIRSKSIFINLIVTFVTLTLLSTISYFTTREFFKHNVKETVYLNLNITMDNIDRNMKLLSQMLNWLTLNNEIQAYVNATGIYPDDLRFKALASYNIIRNAVYSNGLSDYINKLIVGNHMGNSVQYGIIHGHQSDYSTSLDTFISRETVLIPDPHYFSNGELVLPINYPINSSEDFRSSGHLFITLNTSIISRFTNLNENKDDQFYMIAIGGQLYDIQGSDLTENSNAPPFHRENIKTERNRLFSIPSIPSYKLNRNGIIEEYVVFQGSNSGWFLFQRIPENHLTWQSAIFSRLLFLVILIMILMVLTITYILDRTVNRPIIQVEKRISKIALGDFSHDPSIEFNNEIGNIGRGINHMVSELTQHIAAEIHNEKMKKDLEFKILQSQINPHFLYNTLNSIKWMATIQKSKGIAEMVGSLALLLKQLAKGTEKMISLKRELLLIEEYCKIQNYRTAGMVVTEYVIEDEELLNYSVIQFTLQPIVENAIFHGLEPRQLPGKITIDVRKKDEDSIIIDITDNGIGIPEHRISGLLEEQYHSEKSLNHIGLKNVNERLKLTYGKDYGLQISSIEGEYTRVSIVFPMMNKNEEKSESYD